MKSTITNYSKNTALILFSGILFTGLLFTGCQKEKSSTSDMQKKGNVLVNSDQASINSRISNKKEIMCVKPIISSELKGLKEPPKVDLNKNYVFTLRADVAPPSYDGHTLQATHVKIYDRFAFVTYNTKGNHYLGGLEIFDVNDIDNPKIIKSLIFPDADVSSVDYYNNKLYIVGAINIDIEKQFPHLKNPSMLEVISVNSTFDVTSIDTVIDLGTFVGTDVRVTPENIFATSGTNGFVKVFNHAFDSVYSKPVNDARAVEANNTNVFVLNANPAQINIYNSANATEAGSFPVWDQALQNEAKSELSVSDKYIFAALNYGGMKMLNTDGTLKSWTPKPPTPDGKLAENYVTNSVSLNGDLVLFSNGEAGLYIGGLISSRDDSLAILGRISFPEGQSVNHVESKDSIIFVATGAGGLKILSISIDPGLPPVIIKTKPCATLIDSIISYFPELVDNTQTYPDLFSGKWAKQIILSKESEVYLTFLYENAGWKNSFGYYTYNINNPPSSIDNLNKQILFPNVSMENEGGALKSGYTVQVGTGKFPVGTVIGFYLVAQGWNYGMLDNGLFTHYTDNQLNIGRYQQHILFKEKKCGDLVMIFEDKTLDVQQSDSDKDFNDIMFTISDSTDPIKIADSFDLNNIKEF